VRKAEGESERSRRVSATAASCATALTVLHEGRDARGDGEHEEGNEGSGHFGRTEWTWKCLCRFSSGVDRAAEALLQRVHPLLFALAAISLNRILLSFSSHLRPTLRCPFLSTLPRKIGIWAASKVWDFGLNRVTTTALYVHKLVVHNVLSFFQQQVWLKIQRWVNYLLGMKELNILQYRKVENIMRLQPGRGRASL
jgi:hypothetical protein